MKGINIRLSGLFTNVDAKELIIWIVVGNIY